MGKVNMRPSRMRARPSARSPLKGRISQPQLENASCVESLGLESYTGVETEATIVNRTEDGVRVDVIHSYWYSTADEEADSAAEATYFVTADDAQRVNGNTIITC